MCLLERKSALGNGGITLDPTRDYDADSEVNTPSSESESESESEEQLDQQKEQEGARIKSNSSFQSMSVRRHRYKRIIRRVPHPEIDCSLTVHISSNNYQPIPASYHPSLWRLSRYMTKWIAEINHGYFVDGPFPANGCCFTPLPIIPSFLSQLPVTLEEAVQLSLDARLVIESDPPHQVVHANAAYRRLRGFLTTELTARCSDDPESNLKCFGEHISDEIALLQVHVYPILGSEEKEITHFLFWVKHSGRFLFHLSHSKGSKVQLRQTVG